MHLYVNITLYVNRRACLLAGLARRNHVIIETSGQLHSTLGRVHQIHGNDKLLLVQVAVLVHIRQLPDLSQLGNGQPTRTHDALGGTAGHLAVLLTRGELSCVLVDVLL